MEWLGAFGGQLLTAGIAFLFFWTLVGQYAYREAKAEGRSMPKRRGLCWGVLGIVGVIDYLRDIRNRDESRLGWIGFAAVLFAFWAIEPVVRQEPPGWYAWAGVYTGLFVLYWQFDLEASAVAER
ncbi:hypothetical protein C448_14328 [Halococcus morrhuae DSM 1307]|uniref:Uncharacterized protein n=1 Tax=Halococcus morrhuae DSM 1307 TaxID=931277 RepID=M0M229_HALMO|nr:hypothetical protein [Halococcus morrhuae]EMA39882.1 hypothetical protein C448_14328 [Halococcus morrhuae DSM 1307]